MSAAGSNFRADLSTVQAASKHVYEVNGQIQA
jgi:hypothetical protein